jgi:hypothetical protein
VLSRRVWPVLGKLSGPVEGAYLMIRNALRLAREAEETARGTIGKLADQSGQSSLHCVVNTG